MFPGALRVKEDYTLTEEQGQKISSESSVQNRIKAIKDLGEVVRSHCLEEVMSLLIYGLPNELHNNIVLFSIY